MRKVNAISQWHVKTNVTCLAVYIQYMVKLVVYITNTGKMFTKYSKVYGFKNNQNNYVKKKYAKLTKNVWRLCYTDDTHTECKILPVIICWHELVKCCLKNSEVSGFRFFQTKVQSICRIWQNKVCRPCYNDHTNIHVDLYKIHCIKKNCLLIKWSIGF